MTEDSEDWATVRAAIRARRNGYCRLTQEQAAHIAGIGIQTWRNLESGKPGDTRDSTLAAVEETLGWPQGTIRSLAKLSIEPMRPATDIEARLVMLEDQCTEIVRRFNQVVSRMIGIWEEVDELMLPDNKKPPAR